MHLHMCMYSGHSYTTGLRYRNTVYSREFNRKFETFYIGQIKTAIFVISSLKFTLTLTQATNSGEIILYSLFYPDHFILPTQRVRISHSFNRDNDYTISLNCSCCPVGWGCRIHQLLLCRGVRPHQRVSWI